MGYFWKMLAMSGSSVIEPTQVVVGEARMSIPTGLKPSDGRVIMRAWPKWPAEPVTRTSYWASVESCILPRLFFTMYSD